MVPVLEAIPVLPMTDVPTAGVPMALDTKGACQELAGAPEELAAAPEEPCMAGGAMAVQGSAE